MTRIKHRDKKYPGCWYYETNGNKVFYCCYRKEGKNVTAKCGESIKGYTFKLCLLRRADLLRGKEKTNAEQRIEKKTVESRSIDKLYTHYLEEQKGKGRNDSVFNRYVNVFWKNRDIGNCINQDAANFKKWLENCDSARGGKLSPQTVKHAIGLFRRIVRCAVRTITGFTLEISEFKIPKVNNEVTEDLTEEELDRLVLVLKTDTVNRAVCDMMLLILNTGMRRGEVQKLQWQHVSFERKTLLIKEPKGKIDVKIPINQTAREVLQRQKKTSMFVFPGKDGKRRGHFERAARRIRDLAGLPKDFRPCHGLRHFYGTELSSKGVSLLAISELMGHKDVGVTQRYVKSRTKEKVEAVELISIGGSK